MRVKGREGGGKGEREGGREEKGKGGRAGARGGQCVCTRVLVVSELVFGVGNRHHRDDNCVRRVLGHNVIDGYDVACRRSHR